MTVEKMLEKSEKGRFYKYDHKFHIVIWDTKRKTYTIYKSLLNDKLLYICVCKSLLDAKYIINCIVKAEDK